MQSTTLPPLKGIASKYRIYTVEHLAFDAVPAYPAGPATVVLNGWCMSTSSLSKAFSSPSAIAADDGKHTLSVRRGYGAERHELDGTKYDTSRDASRAAYEAGVLGFMVYERDTAEWGLPTG